MNIRRFQGAENRAGRNRAEARSGSDAIIEGDVRVSAGHGTYRDSGSDRLLPSAVPRQTNLYRLVSAQSGRPGAGFHASGRAAQELGGARRLGLPEIAKRYESVDGTRRYLLSLADGRTVETVLMPEAERDTVCIPAGGLPWTASSESLP